MSNQAKDWRFINETQGGKEVSLGSFSQGIELLMETSRKGMGEAVYFQHAQKGSIGCTVGCGLSTLSFDPQYDPSNHSLSGFNRAVPKCIANLETFFFVDSTSTISSIKIEEMLPIVDVVRAVLFILENHDYPTFLRWRPGC